MAEAGDEVGTARCLPALSARFHRPVGAREVLEQGRDST